MLLGEERARRFASAKHDGWYPVAMLLEAHAELAQRIGDPGLRKIGRQVMALIIARHAPTYSAREFLHAFDSLYRAANRGSAIGGWRVLSFEPGLARIEKTTPLACAFEHGIIDASLRQAGCPSHIAQTSCVRRRDPTCVYEIISHVTDERWSR